MDRHGRVGEQDGRGLAGGIRLDEDIDEEAVVDTSLFDQKTKRQQAPPAVERHVGGFLLSTGPDGQGLQLTGGEQSLGKQRNVIVGGLAEAKVLRGDVEITEMDQRAVTGRRDLEGGGDDGDGGGTGHEGSPAVGEVHPRLYGARPRPSFPAF